ncbi:MAG: glucose-6-phosphate isomerase family protein [Minisyncoccus archaeiphilus]|jgi:glucose-6-phosphate isomerase|uniref:glucose-6-phosphate isomerase family protein n=1 Tax=Minisyncoccus archaeiphilus TaxID=3238481 RepID=UPI0009D2B4D3|nr:MAG: glucose-6-phosphate isomerase [Parcubacteria group bacterium ADurb.Bin216]GMX59256.1 MAG: glucose-6-phosphate isomerase family protein [Candidatus Parcubacteria bacterium]
MQEIDLSSLTPDIRKLEDMSTVVLDKEWLQKAGNPDLYYMYRGVKEKDGLRHDITVIPAMMMGKEFVKTKGHFHSSGHPELYTVLEGKAIFLMQKGNQDCYIVEASAGQSVIIPGDYEHITINPSPNQQMKMANWISLDYSSDYSTINDKQGACWFYTTEGWKENPNYGTVPSIRKELPLDNIPDDLSFLKKTV